MSFGRSVGFILMNGSSTKQCLPHCTVLYLISEKADRFFLGVEFFLICVMSKLEFLVLAQNLVVNWCIRSFFTTHHFTVYTKS